MDAPGQASRFVFLHIFSGPLHVLQKCPGTFIGFSSHRLGDHGKGDHAGKHEDQSLKSIRPCRTADATQKDVSKHHATDDQTCFPRGNIRGALHEFTSADNPDKQVGNDKQHQQNKEYRAEGVRLETFAEELDLRHIPKPFPDGPQTGADDEKHGRMDDPTPHSHCAKGGHASHEGFAGGPDQRETGHGGAEHAHQQHERANGSAGDKVVLARATEQRAAEDAQAEQGDEICAHHPKRQTGFGSGS